MRYLKQAGIIVLMMLSMFVQAATVDKSDPYLMMDAVSEATFARLKADQARIQSNPEYLRTVITEELLPYINVRYAAYKVLGPQLKKTTKEQRNAFVAAFNDYLVASYAQVMTQYKDQDIKIEPKQSVPADRNIVSVRVDIVDPKRPPIRLDFKLRKNKKTNEWQGFDMVAEGVSMISTKQSEWSGKLRSQGVEAVTADLKTLAAKPIRFESTGDD